MGGNPRGMLQQLMSESIQRDPEMLRKFQTFVQTNQNRSFEDIAREGGISFDDVRRMLG